MTRSVTSPRSFPNDPEEAPVTTVRANANEALEPTSSANMLAVSESAKRQIGSQAFEGKAGGGPAFSDAAFSDAAFYDSPRTKR